MKPITVQETKEYRSIIENVMEGIFQTSTEGRFIRVNLAMARIFGYKNPEEMVKRVSNFSRDLFVEHTARDQLLNALVKHEQVEGFEARFYRKDGIIIWIRINARPVCDEEGEIQYFEGYLTDITMQKDAEIALKESEQKYRQLFQSVSDAIILIDSESGRILEINEAASAMYGYSREELLKKNNSDLSAQAEEIRIATLNRSANDDHVFSIPLEYHRKKDGTVFPVEVTGRFFDFRGKSVRVAAIRDITERIRVEEALRESEQNFRYIVEHTTNIYYSHSPDHNLTFMSPQALEILGYEPEDALINWHEFLTDNPVNQEGIQLTQKAIDTGKRQRTYILELKHKDGHNVWVEVHESPIVKDGKTVSIVGALTDITEHKHAEEIFRHQLNELTVLHNIALTASSSKSLDELIKRTIDTIYDTLLPDCCGIELVSDSEDTYFAHPSYRGAQTIAIRNPLPLSRGITGLVISKGEPVRLGNVAEDPNYIEIAKDIRSELCVPIKIQDRIIGAINIESKQAEMFNESDQRLLTTIAGTLASAIEQLRLFETSQQRLKELTILNRVSLASTAATSIDDLIENITQIIGESLYPDNFGVLLLNENSNSLSPHPSYRGISVGKFPTDFSLDIGICGQVAASGKPLRIANVRNHKSYIEVTSQVRSEVCVPITHGDRIMGVINAESLKINKFTEDDERLLLTIASTIATSIEKLRLLEAEKKRRQAAETLRETTAALTVSFELEELYKTIFDSLAKLIPFDSASIEIINQGVIEVVASHGLKNNNSCLGQRYPYDAKKWGSLATLREPIIIADVQEDDRFVKFKGTDYIHGWMGVPMFVQDQLFGILNLDSSAKDFFTQDHAALAQTFVNQAAISIENARLFNSEQSQRKRNAILLDLMRVASASLTLDDVMQTTLERINDLIPFESGTVQLLEGSNLRIAASTGIASKDLYLGRLLPLEDFPLNRRAIEHKLPIYIPDTNQDDNYVEINLWESVRSFLAVPLEYKSKIIGLISLVSKNKAHFTDQDIDLIFAVARHASIAIENARLFQEESRRSQILEAMANIANEFATAQDILPALDKITNRALGLLNASTVAIYLLQDDNKTIKVVTAQGTYREQLMSHTLQIGTGITGNVIASGKPEIVDDLFNDSRRVRVPGTPEEDAQRDTIMSAPLILRGKTIGAINAWRKRISGLFNASELNFLVSIAHQSSISLESIRLIQETARRAQEAHAIAEVGRDISSTLQLDIVLERIAKYAKELLRAETSAVYLTNSQGPELRAIAAIGTEASEIMNDPLTIGSGILGNIALQRFGEIVNDTKGDPRAITIKGTKVDPNEHLMGVPVLSKDLLTGLLAVWRTGASEEFKPSELDFLSSLAQQAAVAIENARLFEAEQRHFQEAETLRQAAEAITSTLDIQQVLEAILDNLNRVIPFDSASVFLIESNKVRLTAYKGMEANGNPTDQLFPADNELFLEIWQTGRALILEDAQDDPRYENWVVDRTRGWMGVPLITRGNIIGYITIDSLKIKAYEEHDANLAMTFAHQAAMAIENARLYEQGEKQIRQLTVLRDIDSAISSSFDLRVILNLLIGYAARELNVDAIAILLFNSELKSLFLYTSTGFINKQNNTNPYIRLGEGLAGHAIMQRKLVQVADFADTTEIHPTSYVNGENFKSYFGIPLISKGQIKGVMEVFTRQEYNPDEDWLNFLHILAGQAAIAIDNVQMFKNLQRSNQELVLAYDTTLAGWGRALELRDKETQGHTDRVIELTLELARRVGVEGEELTHIIRGTMLHDIGKMGIPDHILHKPGPLDENEWVIMKQHPQYAYDLMNPIPYLRQSLDIPYAHHERWDGSGYPRGLKGEEIPLAARIFAVVDIWDALLYKRAYRDAWPEEKVIEYLKSTAGIELDPGIVAIFLELIEEQRYENQAE